MRLGFRNKCLMQPEVFRCHCKLRDLFPFQGLRVSRPKTAGQQVHHADVRGQPQPVQTPPGPRHHRGPADEGSGPGREAAEEDGEVCWGPRPLCCRISAANACPSRRDRLESEKRRREAIEREKADVENEKRNLVAKLYEYEETTKRAERGETQE